MKSFKLLLAVCLAVASCNKSGTTNDWARIDVKVNVSHMETRAGYEGTSVLPDVFYMDICQNSGAKYDYSLVEIVKSYASNQYSVASGENLLWATKDHSDVSIKAMTLPLGLYQIDQTTPMRICVANDQTSEMDVRRSDLLCADTDENGGVTIQGNTIDISFRHLLTKLDLSYSFGNELQNSNVTVTSITLKDICIACGYDYSAMNFTNSVKPEYGDLVMYLDNSRQKAEAIFVPYVVEKAPKIVIKATIDGVERAFACTMVVDEDGTFASGCRYTVNVSINGSSIGNVGASIAEGWDSDTAGDRFFTE